MVFGQKTQSTWILPKSNPGWLNKIIKEFNIHPVTAQIMVSRGFSTIEEIHNFLYATLPHLYDPSLFKDMDKAIARILQALKNKEGILIYGDNDVDGMTATALLVDFFKNIGAKVFFYMPDSTQHKRSVISDALQYALKNSCSLIITVDCGITAAKEIQTVVEHDIDVIITDHHEPTSKIPHCIATLNPKLVNSTYPNRDITGVGVAFKLAHALTNHLIESAEIDYIDLKSFLDLVALGTISDMGALLDENRILVKYGLRELQHTKRIGLSKLFDVCELNKDEMTPIDIASKIAPRLNSIGRIANAKKGVELLLIKDDCEAESLAKELDIYNIERQKIERKASDDIEKYIASHPEILNEKAIVLYSNKWHPGIIPIITARITKQYNRPTLLIAIENGIGKGSMRTISSFPLLPILKENEHLLINFGGHDFAAGLTVNEQNIEALKKSFIDSANSELDDKDIISKMFLDAETNFDDLTFDFMESIKLLEPFGNENPPPLLYCEAKQIWTPKIVGKIHLKMYLEQKDRMLEGIGFGMAKRKNEIKKKNLNLKVVFTPHINVFLNKASIQLHIKDFKVKT
ncbi:MAG: Single-stranded-DNA-specific exonuclease RecJ [Candidatus Anoxychlamydiales bacterium]|nr:Single-stranded-DNA-specific exonuclease RecJ [Candidatus Anoxychlamydiales bacterium]NGX35452.1 Single-stranded-DNA-specific exonuclease RecJ [Candidatus Anoxychlamydiales bacterium]